VRQDVTVILRNYVLTNDDDIRCDAQQR
jgi:hypothetical protein